MGSPLPYQLAVLCYLSDREGRLLLLHRAKEPNKGLYSPIGGKLKMEEGESPADCARREIQEEVAVDIGTEDLRLAGLVSEAGYADACHWLMFLYEVVRPVEVTATTFREGTLEWHAWERVFDLPIPETDRQVILPLLQSHRGRFFHVHIDCRGGEVRWRVESTSGG